MIKIYLLMLGLVWSGGLITLSALKTIDLGSNRDFFIGVFGGSAAGLGLSKSKDSKQVEKKLEIDLENPETWPKDE